MAAEGEHKPGMSTGAKVALGLGAAAVVGVAAVGAIGALAWAGSKAYKNHRGHAQDGSHFRLHVHVISAKGLKNTDLFGKSDPFVTVDVGNIKLKTKVIDNNLNPVWNEQLEMGVLQENLTDHIELEVYDEDPGSNELLGKAFINFDQVPHGTPKRFDLALNTQGSLQLEAWTSGTHEPVAK